MATASPTQADEIVHAVHPHWRGRLTLSAGGRVRLIETGSAGGYARAGRQLTILWDDYPPERFVLRDGRYHQFGAPLETLVVPGSDRRVALRSGNSDGFVFQQVFIDREYDSPDLPASAETIVDLGANIGLASLFFAERYPMASIVAVEPDADNFALLSTNLAPFGDRVSTVRAAAWSHDGRISLVGEDTAGVPLGSWGLQVAERHASPDTMVPCQTLTTVLDGAGFARVDLLKVDIEGAELEVFAGNADAWLSRIDMIAIETHDRFRPGSEAAVRTALAALFEELPARGENLFFRARRR